MARGAATFLLPARDRFGGQRLAPPLAKAMGRGDRLLAEGEQRARVFDVLPRGWPVASVTRQRDVHDAAGAAWLRADPAHVRPDINGARLLAYGAALALTPEESAELLRPLRPLFGDSGFPIDAPSPSRWYLRLPRETRLPAFTAPEDALGADLFEHLPEGSEGRRWRALLSEAQVVLHNHPVNARRAEAGRAPVNSLWFWGAGVLPDHVATPYDRVVSDDEALQAFGAVAGVAVAPLTPRWAPASGTQVIDLRHARDLARVQQDWLLPALDAMRRGELDAIALDFADGTQYALRRNQRWRVWRRAAASLSA